MKSRTSSFKTILRKDILRFAPLWALYLIGGIMILFSGTEYTVYKASPAILNLWTVTGSVSYCGIINLIYAVLVVQLLFGDLFNSRMCNALHAMPMRRETWFLSHVLSGLCFSLVPNLIMTLVMLPMLGDYWYVSFLWLLSVTLEYLCFFGLAVFSVFCTGNRFAMVAVYGVLNFFALILLWFIETIYQPFLYGFAVTEETFYIFSPVLKMLNTRWIEIYVYCSTGYYVYISQEGWCLAAYAAIGAVLLGAGLLLYRRRKLECAGNFMAVKTLAPIFSVIFALFVGALFAMFGYNGNGTEDYLHLIFLSVGLVVGYFAGQMLLQRTVKVFKPMAFVKLAVLVVTIFASIGLTVWDPLGFEEWVPEADEVQSVTLTGSAVIWDRQGNLIEIQDQGIIENIIDLHKMALRNGEYDGSRYSSHVDIDITYTMKDGRTVKRRYSTTYDGTTDEYIDLIREYKSIAVAAQ